MIDASKIENKKKGREPIFTDEQLIEALESGLFTSQAAIARYFGVTAQAISSRIKKLKKNGKIKEDE